MESGAWQAPGAQEEMTVTSPALSSRAAVSGHVGRALRNPGGEHPRRLRCEQHPGLLRHAVASLRRHSRTHTHELGRLA